MLNAPITSPSLVVRLRDFQDRAAWGEFVEIYGPPVYRYGCTQGLQDADAADLTQAVFRSVSGAIGKFDYDPQIGSFRGWLFTIVRNQLRSMYRQTGGLRLATGDSGMLQFLQDQPAPDESAQWEASCESQLFHFAAERVQKQFRLPSWQAFWQTAVEGKPPEAVARDLKMSVAAVYMAKSRVMARLREVIQQVQD
jgi:RNA polymerase sigma factor (sigma-70 family)